jgi:hypothetical protein
MDMEVMVDVTVIHPAKYPEMDVGCYCENCCQNKGGHMQVSGQLVAVVIVGEGHVNRGEVVINHAGDNCYG